jgi:sugar lactone lactonase YvrE
MTPSAKLGMRIAVGATIASAVMLGTATIATRASGAAKVTTVAGSAIPGASGDGQAATAATLAGPTGVATDAAGNVAIADTGNCRVRFIAATGGTHFGIAMQRGRIYTIGGSTCGTATAHDDGPAVRAHLSFPSDVAFGPGGDVYVADTGNNLVRVISAQTGEIATRAGELDGPMGIAVDAHGNLFVADTNNCRVREVPTGSGVSTIAGNGTCGTSDDGTPATRAALRTPAEVAVDAHGNLFVADAGNRVVREVPAVPGTNFGIAMTAGSIYTIAGSGTYNVYFGDGLPAASDASSLSFPNSITLDAAGNLYVADTYARAVRIVPATAGTSFGIATQPAAVFTIAGAGPTGTPTAGGTKGDSLVYPGGVAVDTGGNVYVADSGNNRVERLSAAG